MIFVDANVPLYVLGSDPGLALRARLVLQRALAEGDRLVTNVEVLQEILHRYRARGRLDEVQTAFDLVYGVVDEILPIDEEDIRRARDILLARPGLDARDAVHLATMERLGVSRIASFDRDFDVVPGIERLA